MNTIAPRPVDAVIAAVREFLGDRLSTAQAIHEAIIVDKTRLYRVKETVAKSELLFREMRALTKHHLH